MATLAFEEELECREAAAGSVGGGVGMDGGDRRPSEWTESPELPKVPGTMMEYNQTADLPDIDGMMRSDGGDLAESSSAAKPPKVVAASPTSASAASLTPTALVLREKFEEEQGMFDLFKELIGFTAPLLAIWISGPVLSLVDAAVVGAASTVQLAALGPATSISDQATYLCSFLAIATTNMLAVAEGKGDGKSAAKFLKEALALSGMIGLAIAVAGWYGSEPLLRTVLTKGGGDIALLRPAADYLKVRALVMPACLVGMVTQSAFLAWKKPVFPLISMAVAASFNLVGDIVLCNRYGMGCLGAALATAAAQVSGTVFLMRMLGQQGRASNLPAAVQPFAAVLRWPGWRSFARFAVIAGPISFILLTKAAMYGSVIFFTSSLGTKQLAAHVATYSVFVFFAVIGDSTSQAAQAYLPARLHNTAAVRKLVAILLGVGLCVGVFASACSGGMLYALPRIFTQDGAVIRVIRSTAPSVSLTMIFHAMGITAEGMLMAGRDMKFLCCCYVVNLALTCATLALGASRGWGLPGIWLALGQFMFMRLAILAARLAHPSSILYKPPAFATARHFKLN